MKIRLSVIILLIFCTFGFAAEKKGSDTKIKLGGPAPQLKGLKWVKGGPVEFKKGNVYIVEFWATWCGPCRVSIPHLTEVQKKYKDKNVYVIGISDETIDKVKPFVEKMGDKMDYNIAIDAENSANNNYMSAFNQNGIPTAFIIDKQTRIVWLGHPLTDMDKVLEQTIAGTFDIEKYQKERAEAQAKFEKAAQNYKTYFDLLGKNGREKAEKTGREVIKDGDAYVLNQFAWQILNYDKKEQRDLALALEAAKKANDLTEGKEAPILDTYASALFESALDKINKAVEYQKKAVELGAKYEQMLPDMKKSLEKYEAAAQKMAK